MITALSVRIPEKSEGLKKIANKLRRDKVEIKISRARGVTLKHITYTSFSGEVRLDRADKIIGEHRNRLLCSEKLIFPPMSGYRRFESQSFSSRLCANMALEVLKEFEHSADLCLGIYDPRAVAADFMLKSLEYCSNPVALSYNHEPYALARERALDELGASVTVTKNVSELDRCDFIVAPANISEHLPIKAKAVILTVGEPSVPIGGEWYGNYCFRMPNGFDAIKPRELSEEYFCSALYTLGAQYELGSIVPLSCTGKSGSQTVKSLCKLLDKRIKREYNN